LLRAASVQPAQFAAASVEFKLTKPESLRQRAKPPPTASMPPTGAQKGVSAAFSVGSQRLLRVRERSFVDPNAAAIDAAVSTSSKE
jgi:hypothetical protein